ncbi:MAG: 50S ribosomal protein L18e [Candidatus Nanoarchaeia archaeon]|nr:50S ribosomal protein L18e [Candidatus Nanoarchaeia archaeon]
MAKSKTKINEQLRRKRNPELVDTIIQARKSEGWKRVSEILASPRKNKVEKNLNKINEESKEGETIIIPGKVLSMGELSKKIKIAALKFSHGAEEKILKSGGKVLTILEEIKKNPDAKGIKILE